MSKKPSIGATSEGQLLIDIPRLLKTRLMVQSSSGGGKSWVLRRILEQTASHVQQIILDIEGEFISLREKFDYVICAPQGADAIATPQTATILARRLRETRVSAIIDMYELKMQDRKRFVRLFLEELVEAPKSMWHPCLVVIDEAHLFCPEKDEAESAAAVNDLITRGRKRGLCGLLATQRLAKLSKDSAAELHNKLIGSTVLDTDVKRAADDLGMNKKEATSILRALDPGEFYCFGPALSRAIVKVKVGPVQTTHPEPGAGTITKPPEPSAKIKALLAKLTDLPKEADQEARTLADFKAENAKLKRELTISRKAEPRAPAIEIKRIEVPAIKKHELKWLKECAHKMSQSVKQIAQIHERNRDVYDAWVYNLNLIGKGVERLIASLDKVGEQKIPPIGQPTALVPRTVHSRPPSGGIAQPRSSAPGVGNGADPTELGVAARKILAVLSQFPEGCNAGKLTLLAGYRYAGGFRNSLSELRTAGLMVGKNTEIMRITDAGLALGPFEPLPQGRALIDYWLNHNSFGPCERKILAELIAHPNGLTAQELCERTNYQYAGGFRNSLSSLRTAGVMIGSNTGTMRVSEDLLNG